MARFTVNLIIMSYKVLLIYKEKCLHGLLVHSNQLTISNAVDIIISRITGG